jgi:DNA polymerase III subunit delta
LLYILWGEDEFSREEALAEIKKGLGDPEMLSTSTSLLEGAKLSLNELRGCIETVPFLAPCRLVIIKGLLERFEPSDKAVKTAAKAATTASSTTAGASAAAADSAGAKTAAKPKKGSSKADDSAALAECIRSMPPSTVLILSDNIEFKKPFMQTNPLFTAISEKAQVKSFPALRSTRLSQWIQERVARYSGSISIQATNLLMGYVGGDLFAMSNEIQKLAAYTAGRKIEEKDVRAVVSASQEADIFALIDAILDNKAGVAEQILQKLLQNGVAVPQMLTLLARQVQMLVQIKELKGLKKSSTEIQTRLGIYNSFIWERTSSRAQRYSLARLKSIYRSLVETDLVIKTGRFEPDLAINILAADLCQNPGP